MAEYLLVNLVSMAGEHGIIVTRPAQRLGIERIMSDGDFSPVDLKLGMLTVYCQVLKLRSRESINREPIAITIAKYAVYGKARFAHYP